MAKLVTKYVCTECGHVESKWMGRCPACNSWNSFEEEVQEIEKKSSVKSHAGGMISDEKPHSLASVEVDPEYRFNTGISELDRVLGGGVMKGSSVLLGGEPGIGKSTMMLQVAASVGRTRKTLYVSGEETQSQVKLRADRLKLDGKVIEIYSNTHLESLVSILKNEKPEIVIVDSLQTMSSNEIDGVPGAVSQIRECATGLVEVTKQLGITLFLIAHVNKEGAIAGPKLIEHLVDTVLYFDQAGSGVRLIRAAKNRYGSVDELGVFTMTSTGLEPVDDPTSFFISEREGDTPSGVVYTAAVEGTRAFLVEIQALCVPAKSGYSRIYSDKIDTSRVSRVAAVLERHIGLRLSDSDIYVNVAGGFRLDEPAIELPLAIAIYSALANKPLKGRILSFGEISLAGEVRPVPFADKREKAASDLGFKRVIMPKSSACAGKLSACKCDRISDALRNLEI